MNLLYGVGHGAAVAVARAVLVQEDQGRPTLPPDILAEAARRARYRGDGPLDLVLVVGDAAQALFVRLPGLAVVGVVAEETADTTAFPEEMAVITGVTGARDAIPEGEWVIVDPVRGRVVVEPDAAAIARVQAAPERPRVLLGAAHFPARTLGGTEVAVWAVVRSEADLEKALADGADGLVVTAPSDLLPGNTDSPEAQTARLLPRVEAVGGGALALDASLDLRDPAAVVAVAARCEARWLLRPRDLYLPLPDLRDELAALVADEQNADRPARLPLLVAVLSAEGAENEEAPPPQDDLTGFDEILLLGADTGDTYAPHFPMRAYLENELETLLPRVLRQGAVGVIVEPHTVAAAKDIIRVQE